MTKDTETDKVISKDKKLIGVAKQKVGHLKHKASFRLSNLLSTKKGRAIAIIAGVIIVLAILFAIPFTRYLALGPIIKRDISITVIDSKTKRPVTNALVELGNKSVQSDKDGIAKLNGVSVGQPGLKVTKQYYQDYSKDYTVPVIFNPESRTVELQASGRQVSILLTNKITGGPVANIVVSSEGTKATSDAKGIVTIILPPAKSKWSATISGTGYNSSDVELTYDPGKTVTFSVTPSGSIYYLSKLTGTINVMKSNLDGTNATVVVQGTGLENDFQTTLLSSRDWKYSALLATRSDDKNRVYLIDNEKGDFTVMDEGDASFEFVGWSGHRFIYSVSRSSGNYYDDKRQSLKSFDAESRTLSRLDQTNGGGSSNYDNEYEFYNGIYIMSEEVVFLKALNGTNPNTTSTASLVSVNPSDGSKKVIKTFPLNSANLKLYEPQGIFIRVKVGNEPATFYEYEDKAIKTVNDTNDNKFFGQYPTFLVSPSGDKTLWYEPRDGKNTIFIGSDEGKDAKTIATLSEYTPYGWFGDNDQYILLSKNGSELYIADANGSISTPYKVTDYHKTRTYPGYGYGYGGQ